MNLPFIDKFNKKVLPKYFLVLVLRDEKVNAVIFQELEGKVKILGQKEEHFSTSIDDVPSEEFLKTLDKAISQAESSLPENIETHKTIFGVKQSWTENDQIKKEYLAKLKKTSEELELTPIGFLVIAQAISHLLQKEEGAPISAILTEVNKKSVNVTLIRAGRIIETKTSEIHDSVPFTVDTVLKHFDVPEILPSRIIIFNGKEDLSQEFINHQWSKSLPFLHIPQITNLPIDFDAKSVLFGAATQMGFEVLDKDVPQETTLPQPALSEPQKENVVEETVEKNEDVKMENFGFAKDVDVAKVEFQDKPQSTGNEKNEMMKEVVQNENPPQATYPTNKKSFVDNIFSMLSISPSTLGNFSFKKIIPSIPNMPRGRKNILIPAIIIAIIGLIGAYFFFVSATVQITLDPKTTEQERNVVFSTTSDTSPSENIIKGQYVTQSEEGEVSTDATGKKEVGDKAKGKVTIFNSNTSEVTLSSGTVITSSNDLDFTIDDSIKIASASSDPFTGIKPSTKDVGVTASKLGQEYNLPSNTKFTVEDADLVAAKNDDPFSGGTKKEVKVVSDDDLSKLEEELPKKLEDKANEDLKKKIGDGRILLPILLSNIISKKSLSADVGDEASKLTLKGTVDYKAISYSQEDLITFSKSLLEKDISENQEIDYNNIKTDVKKIKTNEDDEIEANLNIKALLIPKINEKEIVTNIKGKSFKEAEDIIYKLPQIANVDISLFPGIPFFPQNIPFMEKSIKIQIKK